MQAINAMFFQYDDYCAPILHLGGLSIDLVKTDSEGHARRYIEEIDELPEVILCAGGDGTLSDIVTGDKMVSSRSISICEQSSYLGRSAAASEPERIASCGRSASGWPHEHRRQIALRLLHQFKARESEGTGQRLAGSSPRENGQERCDESGAGREQEADLRARNAGMGRFPRCFQFARQILVLRIAARPSRIPLQRIQQLAVVELQREHYVHRRLRWVQQLLREAIDTPAVSALVVRFRANRLAADKRNRLQQS